MIASTTWGTNGRITSLTSRGRASHGGSPAAPSAEEAVRSSGLVSSGMGASCQTLSRHDSFAGGMWVPATRGYPHSRIRLDNEPAPPVGSDRLGVHDAPRPRGLHRPLQPRVLRPAVARRGH